MTMASNVERGIRVSGLLKAQPYSLLTRGRWSHFQAKVTVCVLRPQPVEVEVLATAFAGPRSTEVSM